MKIILAFQTADGVNIRNSKLFYQTENRKQKIYRNYQNYQLLNLLNNNILIPQYWWERDRCESDIAIFTWRFTCNYA